MKKLIFTLSAVAMLAFTACEKENTCNCGMVTDDGINGSCYWVEIRNQCSGNVKRFCLSQGDWMNAHPGTTYCITNTTGW
jgi:hypothetical protein